MTPETPRPSLFSQFDSFHALTEDDVDQLKVKWEVSFLTLKIPAGHICPDKYSLTCAVSIKLQGHDNV